MEVIYAALIGAIVGSFLNVVIYRFPLAIQESRDASLDFLLWPASTAPCCKNKLRWFENIPVISWLVLRGRCAHCRAVITPRYLIVELLTALIFGFVVLKFGLTPKAVVFAFSAALLIALFFIDLESLLLPDRLTLALLWLGLIAGSLGYLSVTLPDAVWGACAGFGIPWAINYGYRLIRGQDGFGGGDFKLLAALGAWTGWQSIVPILCVASLLGLVVVLIHNLMARKSLSMTKPFAFGPFLIISGLSVLAYSF